MDPRFTRNCAKRPLSSLPYALIVVSFLLLVPGIALSHANIQLVALDPEFPSTTDSVVIQVSGDVFDTSVEIADPVINIVDDQILITIDTSHVGFGLPVVLSYTVDVPIGAFPAGDYGFKVTLWETYEPFSTFLDSVTGNFSVTPLVPTLSMFSIVGYCLLMAATAIVACRHLTSRHCS
jgi:hypothetical protein